jgi:hypothetical protein
MKNTFITKVSIKYGAPMGRYTGPNFLDCDAGKIYLHRVPLDSGGYDQGGAYWGHGEPLFEAMDQDSNGFILRAGSRARAKAIILEDWPEATFYR